MSNLHRNTPDPPRPFKLRVPIAPSNSGIASSEPSAESTVSTPSSFAFTSFDSRVASRENADSGETRAWRDWSPRTEEGSGKFKWEFVSGMRDADVSMLELCMEEDGMGLAEELVGAC